MTAFLVTTSTEGLQPLGSTPQRSFELVSGTLNARLGPEHAALFGDPVATEHGDRIDWHAPVKGTVTALPDLPKPEQAALRDQLGALIGDIRAEAETLADENTPDARRLSEALLNAIEVPDETMIYAVRDASGGLHPVLVHWAWVRNEQAAVRGVLTGMVPRPKPLVPNVAADNVENRRLTSLWWWLILLGWLLLAALFGAILYLLIAPCGVNRGGLVFCPANQPGAPDIFAQERVLQDEIDGLRHDLALMDRGCRASIPVLSVVPVTPATPPEPPTQQDDTKTEADRDEVGRKISKRGAQQGALNFVLEWASTDDIDLFVTCPTGQTVSFSNRSDCGGTYDLDANVAASSAVSDPVENIVFENAAPGLYKVRAHLRSDRTNGDKPVTLHVLRKDGPSNSYSGILKSGARAWTVNISISR